jgi:hypothetical protein
MSERSPCWPCYSSNCFVFKITPAVYSSELTARWPRAARPRASRASWIPATSVGQLVRPKLQGSESVLKQTLVARSHCIVLCRPAPVLVATRVRFAWSTLSSGIRLLTLSSVAFILVRELLLPRRACSLRASSLLVLLWTRSSRETPRAPRIAGAGAGAAAATCAHGGGGAAPAYGDVRVAGRGAAARGGRGAARGVRRGAARGEYGAAPPAACGCPSAPRAFDSLGSAYSSHPS